MCTYCSGVPWIPVLFALFPLVLLKLLLSQYFIMSHLCYHNCSGSCQTSISVQLLTGCFGGFPRCCCGRLVRQHVGFTASLATKYSDVKLGENPNLSLPELEEWSVEKHTEASPTDAYGVVNFQGGSHSYKAKVGGSLVLCCFSFSEATSLL